MPWSPGAIFEDPWADASMRRTIPLFARLGGLAVIATAPFLVEERARVVGLVILASSALVSAQVLRFRNLIDRLPHVGIFVVLSFYCVVIAAAVLATGRLDAPYRLFYVLPVSFTGAFFTGWTRFAMVPIAATVDFVVLGAGLDPRPADSITRVLILGLLALFSAMVADILREALRTNRALHSVLEAASGDPLAAELAEIGVDAALAVADWHAGAVLLIDGDHFRIAALRGAPDELAEAYRRAPIPLAAATMAPVSLRTGTLQYVPDVADALGADNPLAAAGFVSAAALPLAYHGEGVGTLVLAHRAFRRVEGRELDRLERVSRQLGLALGNAEAWRREAEVVDQLRQLNRQKDEFLANVSHELRTPATAIRLVTATMRRAGDGIDEAQRSEMAATLERRSVELSQLIESLLEESVAESGRLRLELRPLEWRASLRSWAETVASQTGRPITLDLPDHDVAGHADPAKVERAVTNLLVNATKFSPPDSDIRLGLRVDAESVHIEVQDHGIGIAARDHEAVFDRFRQVDSTSTRAVGGFGIGLSLVRLYAEAHGGRVTLTSAMGQGSLFGLSLPRQPSTGPGERALDPPSVSAAWRSTSDG